MVRQSCEGVIYLVMPLFFGGSFLFRHKFQHRYGEHRSSFAGQAWFILVPYNILKASPCTVKSDLVWKMNDVVTSIIECTVRGVVDVWTSWEFILPSIPRKPDLTSYHGEQTFYTVSRSHRFQNPHFFCLPCEWTSGLCLDTTHDQLETTTSLCCWTVCAFKSSGESYSRRYHIKTLQLIVLLVKELL